MVAIIGTCDSTLGIVVRDHFSCAGAVLWLLDVLVAAQDHAPSDEQLPDGGQELARAKFSF